MSAEQLAEEARALPCQLVLRRRKRTPNRCRLRYLDRAGGKGLDDRRAIVFDCAQRVANSLPVHVTGAGYAAIVLARVEVAKHALSDLADRIRDALLFDVRVERVDVNLARGTVDVSHEPERLFRQVDHVGLETVQGFDGYRDAGVFRYLADLPEVLDAPRPFPLLLLVRNQTSLAHRGIDRSRENVAAHLLREPNALPHVVGPILTDRRILVGDVPRRSESAADRHRKAVILCHFPQQIDVDERRIFECDLQNVEP